MKGRAVRSQRRLQPFHDSQYRNVHYDGPGVGYSIILLRDLEVRPPKETEGGSHTPENWFFKAKVRPKKKDSKIEVKIYRMKKLSGF